MRLEGCTTSTSYERRLKIHCFTCLDKDGQRYLIETTTLFKRTDFEVMGRAKDEEEHPSTTAAAVVVPGHGGNLPDDVLDFLTGDQPDDSDVGQGYEEEEASMGKDLLMISTGKLLEREDPNPSIRTTGEQPQQQQPNPSATGSSKDAIVAAVQKSERSSNKKIPNTSRAPKAGTISFSRPRTKGRLSTASASMEHTPLSNNNHKEATGTNNNGTSPPPLDRQSPRHHRVQPGAIAISPGIIETDQGEGVVDRMDGHGSDNDLASSKSSSQEEDEDLESLPGDTVGITAELVDEDADQEELERLRRELKELREQQQQQQQQQAQVVVAEPILLEATTISSASAATSHQKDRVFLGSSTATKNGKKEKKSELTIHEPSQELVLVPEGQTNDTTTTTTSTTSSRHHHRIIQANQLQLQLQGRDKEIDALHQRLEDLSTNNNNKQLVLISGYSGCGKTALACALKPAVEQQQGLFVSGKFDLYLRDRPYSGVIAVGKEICAAVLALRTSRSRKRSFREVQRLLNEALSPQDIQALATTVAPGLQDILGCNDKEPVSPPDQGQEAKNRFHFVFKRFLRVVSSCFAPLVIVLDDLQWADAASLELMQVVLTDTTENIGLLLIGLYRSNEVVAKANDDDNPQAHLLATVLHELREKSDNNDNNLGITEMEIGNLDLDSVQSVLMALLSIEDAASPRRDLAELASICHKRTEGNAFFLVSFVVMLEEEGLLEYNTAAKSFDWDTKRITLETEATSNLVDLMKEKLTKLPTETQQLLSLAACLGSSFGTSNLEILWSSFGATGQPVSVSAVQEGISRAVNDGFIEKVDSQSPGKCRWIHDKVQEGAYSLIPEEDMADFKYQAGRTLLQKLSKTELGEQIFLVANLLHETPKEPLEQAEENALAELNLQATQKAISCSAFSSAAKYARKGIACLPPNCWETHYGVALNLYCSGAEVLEIIGDHKSMKVLCDQVLAQESCPILDKVRVYNTLASQTANSGNHVQAVDLLLEVLDQLGCKFPKSKASRLFATLGALIKFKTGAKKRTANEIEGLPILKDPAKIEIMKLLLKLMSFASLCGSDTVGLAIFKSVDLTLKHGICEVSSPAFAATSAMLVGVFGDLRSGHKLGEYALQLENRLNAGVTISRTRFVAVGFASAWQKPWQHLLGSLLQSYSEGMSCGDTESATYGICLYIVLSGMAGKPLKQLEADCAIYSKQMKELKRDQAYDMTILLWQTAVNLRGGAAAQDPTLLQGDVLVDFEKFVEDHRDNAPTTAMTNACQLRLCAVYGEYEKGAKLFGAHGYDWPKAAPAHPMFMESVFSGGLACFAAARNSGKRKDQKPAKKARSTIKAWAKQGNRNVGHYEALLDAELAVLRKKHRAAEQCYQSSIALATRGGYVHDCALANERYGDFVLTVLSDRESARFYVREAIKNYSEWGAAKKVALLQEKYASLIQLDQ